MSSIVAVDFVVKTLTPLIVKLRGFTAVAFTLLVLGFILITFTLVNHARDLKAGRLQSHTSSNDTWQRHVGKLLGLSVPLILPFTVFFSHWEVQSKSFSTSHTLLHIIVDFFHFSGHYSAAVDIVAVRGGFLSYFVVSFMGQCELDWQCVEFCLQSVTTSATKILQLIPFLFKLRSRSSGFWTFFRGGACAKKDVWSTHRNFILIKAQHY